MGFMLDDCCNRTKDSIHQYNESGRDKRRILSAKEGLVKVYEEEDDDDKYAKVKYQLVYSHLLRKTTFTEVYLAVDPCNTQRIFAIERVPDDLHEHFSNAKFAQH